ncbi:MAG: hypothetical protein BWY66_00073 [bacterium ADurb.Bin374]|nr:MAG: hypothetical protein BWY66_00073 [bacterium ADurb.Bin374]
MKLETVLFVMMGLPFALWLACDVINGQRLVRMWFQRRRKRAHK